MELATRVFPKVLEWRELQTASSRIHLDEAICDLLYANTFGKDMNPSVLLMAKGK